MRLNRWVVLAFRAAVSGVFLWAGTLKVLDPLAFARSIEAYRALPRTAAFLLALVLPYIELVCGALLILGLFRKPAALLAAGLSACFVVLVSVTLFRGLDISCGCFGSFSSRADVRLLVQDIVLLGLSLAVLFSRDDALCLDGLLGRNRRRI